jgi:hypothetical protein
VRRERGEEYLLLTIVSFAATVIGTRWYLELTGFPQIGGGELHIAHALWGGLLLFIASLIGIVWTGHLVFRVAAVIAGVGIGLFIDEVGKLITATNDYFYPAAAPIIYATFLVAVIAWLRVRDFEQRGARRQLLSAMQLLEESVEADLQAAERDAIRLRLRNAAAKSQEPEQRRLAEVLLEFIDSQQLVVAPEPATLSRFRSWWRSRRTRWLGARGLRYVIIVALAVSGARSLVDFLASGLPFATDPPVLQSPFYGLALTHLVVEAVVGLLLVAAAVLVGVAGQHRLGWTLAYVGLLTGLALADLVSFYLRQFASIVPALVHAALLVAVIVYRRELEAEDAPGDSTENGAEEVPQHL